MRLIDADAADVKTVPCFIKGNVYTVNVRKWLDEQPTVDAEPVRHGEWKPTSLDPVDPYFRCSVCTWGTDSIYDCGTKFKYCPNCGAKMGDCG